MRDGLAPSRFPMSCKPAPVWATVLTIGACYDAERLRLGWIHRRIQCDLGIFPRRDSDPQTGRPGRTIECAAKNTNRHFEFLCRDAAACGGTQHPRVSRWTKIQRLTNSSAALDMSSDRVGIHIKCALIAALQVQIRFLSPS